jgi:hypothetical protein
VSDEDQADRKKLLAEKFHRLADLITNKMMKFADDIEGYFDDAAEAVDPKTLVERSRKKKQTQQEE